MKNQKISQFLSCAMVFAMMTTFTTGCGDKKSSQERPTQTADQVVKNSYAAEQIEMSEDIKSISAFAYSEADDVYYCNAFIGENYESTIYSISSDFSQFNKIDLGLKENSETYINNISVLIDGGMGVLITENTYGDLPPVDYSDESIDWENFDWQAYEDARETSHIYSIFDKDGNKKSSMNIDLPQDVYIAGCFGLPDGKAAFVTDSQGVWFFDENGKKTDTVETDSKGWIDSIGADADNNMLLGGYGDSGYEFTVLDTQSKTLNSEKIEYDGYVRGNGGIAKGSGDYSFFVAGETSLDGYNKNTKQFEEVVNWIDSDLANVGFVVVGKDMQIVVYDSDYNTGEGCLFKLVKRDSSELAKQQIITIGMMYNDTQMISEISAFNKENSEYRIKTVDYSKYSTEENEYRGAMQKLNEDLISGNAPDIVISSGDLNMGSLTSKGVFADLYEFIDKDEELSREDFIPNVLKLNEYEGKLTSIGTSFGISGMVGKTEFVGEKENWNIDDMISAYENRSKKDMKILIDDYKTSMFHTCFSANLNSYVDYKNKTFNYDKAEMVKLLEFVNQFEEEPDWESGVVPAEYEEKWENYETSMLNDKYLLQGVGIYSFRDFHRLLAGTFGNKPVTFVGYPTSDGSGMKMQWNSSAFSIVSNSGCKDAAWSFIRKFLTEEYQSPSDEATMKNYHIWGFPVNQKAFDKLAEQSKSPEYWIDPETGEKTEYETTFWTGDKEIPIGDITDEEIERLNKLISEIKVSYSFYNSEIYDICNEETEAFFKGDKTAEETADIMINRITIYIAEKG